MCFFALSLQMCSFLSGCWRDRSGMRCSFDGGEGSAAKR